jgi:hypothetical protein
MSKIFGLPTALSKRSRLQLSKTSGFVDNSKGRAWPDRSSFRFNQDLAAGAIALRRGVSEVILNAACQPRWLATLEGDLSNARNHHTAVPGLQEPELLHDQEQEDDHGSARVLEVLQYLPQAHGAQRDEVSFQVSVLSCQFLAES